MVFIRVIRKAGSVVSLRRKIVWFLDKMSMSINRRGTGLSMSLRLFFAAII